MKKKYLLGAFLGLLLSSSAFAQNNIGVDFYNTGEIKAAKEIFQQQLAQSPAESNYYLGEIALQEGNVDQAKTYFQQGLASSPDYALNSVGLASITLKTNAKEGENLLKDLAKNNKKNVEVLTAIARAYYDNNLIEQGDKVVADAQKADKKSPLPYLLQGDLKAKSDAGAAAAFYALAINEDPNNMEAYIKTAKVYENVNAETAVKMLNKALAINPNYELAYKKLGDIYYGSGQYDKAIEAYNKYFKDSNYSNDELTKYAASYYFTKQYPEAYKLIQEGLSKDLNSFVFNRLKMYIDLSQENYEEGLTQAEKFFSLPTDKEKKHLFQDYISYGELLSKNGRTPEAFAQYQKAVELDPTKVSALKDIAVSAADAGDYLNAGNFYEQYIAKADTANIEALDYFNMGRDFYLAGNQLVKDTVDAEQSKVLSKEVLVKASDAFGTVAQRVPDSALGYLWRARSNASLDPETTEGLAKPYYEEVIEVIKKKNDGNSNDELVEAYRYLSYYYYLTYNKTKKAEDKEKVKLYSALILEIDPTNTVANQLLDAVK